MVNSFQCGKSEREREREREREKPFTRTPDSRMGRLTRWRGAMLVPANLPALTHRMAMLCSLAAVASFFLCGRRSRSNLLVPKTVI